MFNWGWGGGGDILFTQYSTECAFTVFNGNNFDNLDTKGNLNGS